MSLDAKKNLIFNTFSGLEDQLGDPDPVKEVRNYRWALRQQTILFQNFLNDLQSERDVLASDYDKRVDQVTADMENEINELKSEIERQQSNLEALEATHEAELNYQMKEQGKVLSAQEKQLTDELLPRKNEIAQQVRDAVRLEELSLAEQHLRELFVLTQNRAEDLIALSEELKVYAKDLNVFGNDFNSFLKKTGAKLFKVKVGDIYDTTKHEAIQIISDSSQPYNTVLEVQEDGYTIKKRVLIRAQVVINVLPDKIKEVTKDINVPTKLVRTEVKELIDTFNENGDLKEVREMQLQRRQEEVMDLTADLGEDMVEENFEGEDFEEEHKLTRAEKKAMKKAEKEARKAARLAEEEAEEMQGDFEEEEYFEDEEDFEEERKLTWSEKRALKKEEKAARKAARLAEEEAEEMAEMEEEYDDEEN